MTDDEEIHNTKMSNFALDATDRKSSSFCFLSYKNNTVETLSVLF